MGEALGDGVAAHDAPLVAALLTPPRPSTTIASRPRVLKLLDRAASSPVTVVSGEAAAGKTTAVVEWIRTTESGRPVAWMTVQTELGDPVLFWRYVVGAVEPLGVDCADLVLSLEDNEAPTEPWLVALANRLSAVPGEPVFVLDDLHELQSTAVFESLLAFLERTPMTLHVLLLTRSMPPWELSRWRVSERLSEIDSADLRFTPDEARDLVDAAEIGLDDAELALLVDRTEGWAGGMRLALLSMRHAADPGAFVARFAADDEMVSSYLFREVLEKQSQEVRSFLLDISILDRVTPDICDALRDRTDSEELLKECRAESLFITEYESSAGYHLHTLFAQLLRATLGLHDPDRLSLLRRRASTAYEEVGDIRNAIAHAMAAHDHTRSGELITRHAGEFARRGRFDEIRSWLAVLSSHTESVTPEVVIGLAMTLSICGKTGDARDQLDRLDAREIAPRVRHASNQARLVTFAIDGRIEAMARAADVLGGEVPDGDLALPFEPVRMSLCYTGIGAFFAGDLQLARTMLDEAAGRCDDPNVQYVEAPGWLARVAHAEGMLTESERHAQECLARNAVLGGDETAVVTPAYLALADVAWERNQLDEADLMLTKARRSVRPLLWYAVLEQVSASRVLASRGSLDEARQQLIECGQTYLGGESSPQLRALLSERALELALSAGDADDVRRWEHTFESCSGRPLPTSLRLRLAALDEVGNIAALVDEAVGTEQNLPQTIDTLLTGAALVGRAGDTDTCVRLVSEATHRAEPNGLVRRLVDGGPLVLEALRKLAADPFAAGDSPVASRFFLESVSSALNAEVEGLPRRAPKNDELVEPLTVRELQVLGLLAGGLSYAEIGSELYVSRNTVKSHASHIYTKLGVSGRTAAAETAWRLGLV